MDGDLFMECEEEELEPWQQMYDDVEEELEFIEDDNVCEASFFSSTSRETPIPSIPSLTPSAAQCVPATVSNTVPSSSVLQRTNTAPPVSSSVLPQFMFPTGVPGMPSLVPSGMVQGQQLIQIQTPTGLSTMLLPTAVNPGAGPANAQQIYFTQGFPVRNVRPGQNPMGIVLNLQQGQMIRPITLLSGPGGQFFAPSMGMPQVVTQPAQIRPTAGPSGVLRQAAPSTFATMQIPATLTIRGASQAPLTTTASTMGTRPTLLNTSSQPQFLKWNQVPVALQSQLLQIVKSNSQANVPVATPLTQGNTKVDQEVKICPRCGAQFKMQEALQGHMCFCCPDLVNTAGPSSSSGTQNPLPERAPSSNPDPPPKVVMLVDDFYYGHFAGKQSLVDSQPTKLNYSFKCVICPKRSNSNIRLMDHMKQHPEMTKWADQLTSCQHCFRQFSSSAQLQYHVENAHGLTQSSTCCKICEWAFESEPVFLHHMKNTHKPGEMPYICQVCRYRSSFFSDVYNHFCTNHAKTCNQLCIYCLKVFKSPNSYQQHYIRHQASRASHCNKCRLQFLSATDRMEHKTHSHRTFRKPKQLEGLQPGTKVTIRAYSHHKGQLPKNVPMDYKTTGPTPQAGQTYTNIQHKLQHQSKPPPQTTKTTMRKSIKQLDLLTKFQKRSVSLVKQRCMECSSDVPSFPDHYPTFVHCAVCPYSTCCSRSYADHMITNHAPRMKTNRVPLHKRPPPCYLKLRCEVCDFSSQTGDLMAKHLAQDPSHGSSTCTPNESLESDIEFCQEEEDDKSGGDVEVGRSEWALMENWREPLLRGIDSATILDFTESCGPRQSLNKNSDAVDYFNMLFPYSLMELIANETNAKAKTCQFLGQRDPDWVPVAAHEIKGFIGLSILMGLQSLPEPANYWSWQHYDNCHTFFRAMSIKRFQQISNNIWMGSLLTSMEEEEGEGSGSDRLRLFRPMLSILGDSMWEAYQPNRCLAIDRALLPSLETEAGQAKGNPKAQPGVWLLCDSKSGYCHRLLIHMGREKEKELGFSVVPPLVKGLQQKHHQLFLGSSLASAPLMQKLLDKGIYASSSFPPPSPILPRELWEQGQLEKPGDFLQRQLGPLLATRWKDTKEMGCLSTNAGPGQPDTVWRKSQTKVGELSPIERPLAFRLLQENMRGVDICKQLLACNPLGGLPLDKHWRSLFWFLVNLSIVNAFIVLRESRKENPPSWVQGGLFTQANFRKRLGHQLAKCAERQARIHSENKEGLASVREVALQGNPNKLRHRLVKLTAKTKRCKNCNLKNLRHESVFGCIVCKANLCKQPSCFWEYHGFSPHHSGSPNVGFIMENMRNNTGADRFDDSSEWGPLGPESDLDEAMAPVEDMGSDTDNEEMEVEGLGKDVDEIVHERESKQQPATSDPSLTPPTVRLVVKEREDTLSVRLLRIVLFALCCGERQAAKQLSTQSNLIRAWLKDKEKQLERDGRGPGRGEAVERMVEWVMAQREQQLPLNEKNLFQRASEIHSQDGHSSAFRISYDWAVSFMLQHSLGWQAVGRTATVSCRLPRSMEDNANSFTKFTRKHIQAHNLPHTGIAAMDELSVFVDIEALADPAKVDKEEALQLVGTREPLVTIYLSALADGTMLRTLVLIKGQLPKMQGTGLPNSVLLEAKVEGFTRDEELALWESQVWRQHMLDQNRSTKGMLILDGHRGHVSKDFLTTLGATGTLPAVVPAGCTCRLQPLEMCLRPVLQSFLLARWARLAAEGGAAGATHKDLVQLLVAWLVEALSYLEEQPDLLRQSFHLTDLVPGQRDQEMIKTLAETQSELMSTLREALLGPEVLEPESPAELEQEDSRGTEDMKAGEERVDEEQEAGEERVDKEQEVKEGKVAEEQESEEGTLDENHKAAIEMDTTKDNILEKGEEEMEPLSESQETGGSHEEVSPS
ncbi:pogo transposable element with ZNF domain isoform X1 [Salvelinus fontinalis]|uniref:pogo transposable element with ZNF domain isoform X1 n=1 Tax=Salvelinus fontinalis TaxID=8038 RepID=UPI0024850566|nr:pogo transposable element with ZNF domain isoform X1 [Salvelinus fontinalis]